MKFVLNLCNIIQLDDETKLSEQCIQGEGLVQVNLELKSVQNIDRINIIDVLKPQVEEMAVDEDHHSKPDEDLLTKETPVLDQDSNLDQPDNTKYQPTNYPHNVEIQGMPTATTSLSLPIRTSESNKLSYKLPSAQNENITRWVMDGNFRKEQERLKIPLGS